MGRKQELRPYRHTVTRYELGGKRVPSGTPGAVKRTTTTETYYVDLPRGPGRKAERVSLETTSEKEAWKKVDELLLRREREAAGLESPALRHAARPLAEHLADWGRHLRDGGNTGEDQVKLLAGRMKKLCELAGWRRLPQIDRASATSALARLQRERARGMAGGYKGRGARTRNHYLRHLKQFVTWCVGDGRLERDPVALVAPVDVESARRHVRRSPSDADVGTLMLYLEGAFVPGVPEGECGPPRPPGMALEPPPRNGMDGPARALAYRLCMATGFRGKELRALSRASFDLARGTVRGVAAHTKNRKEAVLPLPPWLARELRAHFDAGGGCWGRWSKRWPGRILRLDQEACGVAHETDEGFFDFHSLRVWYCTFAANAPGISPKTLQALARHSDPRLTLKVYARQQDEEMRRVVDRLPRPGGAGKGDGDGGDSAGWAGK